MKYLVVDMLKKALEKIGAKLKNEEIEKLIEIPPSYELGDYAFPCFIISKTLEQEPHQIALQIREQIKNFSPNFEDIQTIGGYINFFINKKIFTENILSEIFSKKNDFGKIKGDNKNIMIEFSQPNTHKAFHIGHIRGTSFGESLARILEFTGNKVIRANYSGDTGMHIAKWIWCYKKYHSKEKLKNDEAWIAGIYVDSIKKLGKSKKFQREVDEINLKLENKKDKKLNELWKKTKKLSVDSWKEIYKQLNTKFDIHYFESQVEKKGKEISENLLKKDIAKKSENAIIMDLEKYELGFWVLLRRDGTVLYSAKDLALAEKKFNDYKLKDSITISDVAQNLHFKQLTKTLELMGFEPYKRYFHISYGQVRLPTGKMSSRTGENIIYSEFIKELLSYAKKEIKKRENNISDIELKKRALKISIAAIKYSMLKANPKKNIIFDKNEALNFEGDTGPYILYSYARANSILRKSRIKAGYIISDNLEPKELELIKKLAEFPKVVNNSYKNLNPSSIANYSYQLSQIFNEFYHSCPVLKSKKEKFRISLVKAFILVLENSLNLLGIKTLKKM